MKKTVLAVLAGAVLAATPALAQFEGEITMKMTMREGSGTGKAYVSRAGARSELDMQAGRMPFKMTTLMKFSNPDVMYMINDQQKSYAEIDLKQMKEQAGKMRGEKEKDSWTVKKLGRETVNGYSCEHVLLTHGQDSRTEMEWWTSKDIAGLNYETMRGLMRRGNQSDEGIMKALRDAGADGFVVKMVTHEKGSPTPLATMELTKVQRKSLPASLFEIPAGYTKHEGMMGAASVMASPEQQEQMRKAMESLTPEQRKQIEDMMKARQKNN
jgi:hypothetical protein